MKIRIEDSVREIRIKRIHMEEDAGKLLHEGIENNTDSSYVDLNRAGVPLIEIVTEPDLRNAKEAYQYLKELKAILQFCEVSEANMEEGNLRCDANISLRPMNSEELGTRVEIKNLNSFRNVVRALEYEIERQQRRLEAGQKIIQETRLYDADTGKTEPMRTKEEAQDYRYFPDPDLLPLKISEKLLQTVQESLPELPEAKRQRFVREYSLSQKEAAAFGEDAALADFFEETVKKSGEPKQSANWILRDLLEKLKESGTSIRNAPIRANQLAELVELIRKNQINNTQAKEVFQEMWLSGKMPAGIVSEKGMTQISDDEEVKRLIDQIFAENPELVARFKSGETKLQGFLVGLVMKASGGKANPALTAKLLKERI